MRKEIHSTSENYSSPAIPPKISTISFFVLVQDYYFQNGSGYENSNQPSAPPAPLPRPRKLPRSPKAPPRTKGKILRQTQDVVSKMLGSGTREHALDHGEMHGL